MAGDRRGVFRSAITALGAIDSYDDGFEVPVHILHLNQGLDDLSSNQTVNPGHDIIGHHTPGSR